MDPAEVVLRFLESVGRRSEAEFYLGLFRAEPKERFAAISVDANVARHATEAVVLHLRFLAALGLFPTVVLGLFEPTDALEHASRIRRRLERTGVPAALIPAGDEPLAERIAQTARAGTLPIIAYGATEGATAEERFNKLAGLLTTLQTRKLLFLHRPGGLRQQGVLIPVVNLNADYTLLLASKELSRKERALLTQSRSLVLERIPHKLVVAITSPLNLLRELFTVKGAGTMLRRGAVIKRRDGLADVDRERMKALLTSSFGRAPVESFFERDFARVYLEESYRGAAIVQRTPLGTYLTKFAVGREAQGEGLGRDLWDAMMAETTAVFWRARSTNPIGEWYTKLCDGLHRSQDWTVYWKGLDVDAVPSAVGFALSQPVDLPPALPEAA
jgi:ribosomal protein S18 acetylase RimI-like enzyme